MKTLPLSRSSSSSTDWRKRASSKASLTDAKCLRRSSWPMLSGTACRKALSPSCVCKSTSLVAIAALAIISKAISPKPLPLGLYWLKILNALFLGSPSPRTQHSSVLISAQVAAWGNFSITLLSASPTKALHQLRLRPAAVILLHSSRISKPLRHASMVSSSGLYLNYFSIVRQGSHRCHHFYVPALALQATIHSCTRQKGRKDSDGRVQDRVRIPECLRKSTEKYNGMRGQ